MELTSKFKLANYLKTKVGAFATVLDAIRANKTLPPAEDKIADVLKKYGSDKLLKHPETLVDGMYCYLGKDVTWNFLLGVFRMDNPGYPVLDTINLYAHSLEKFKKYDQCNNSEMKKVIRDALLHIRKAELERVKLLLSWEIIKDYGYIHFGEIEMSSRCHLTEQIVSRYSDHATYVMTLIFNQIQREDLVEKLTIAAMATDRERWETKAMSDEEQRGSIPT